MGEAERMLAYTGWETLPCWMLMELRFLRVADVD